MKANALWFVAAATLAHWQALAKGGDAQALSACQDKVLHDRHAWQVDNPQPVRLTSDNRARRRIKVKMTGPGRFRGMTWFLDDVALPR